MKEQKSASFTQIYDIHVYMYGAVMCFYSNTNVYEIISHTYTPEMYLNGNKRAV